MPQIRNLAIIFLVLGVIMAEFLPNINPATNLTAYSQINTSPNQSEVLLNFLDAAEQEANNPTSIKIATNSLENFSNAPTGLTELATDISNALSSPTPPPVILGNKATPESTLLPTLNLIPETDQPFIENVIPPSNTPLSEAYLAGGKAWYTEDGKVIVKWPDKEIFKSFDKATGEEIDWLQDRLSYEPLDSFNALTNYVNNYHGEIVAETKTWAFVKFPSGGFIKIAKSTASTIPFLTQE